MAFAEQTPASSESSSKNTFSVRYAKAITEFDKIMQRLNVKKVLYRTILRGKGLEFESYRRFGQDDDASFIDWGASLRSNELLSRVYIEERNLNVIFLVDVGGSMLFGSKERLKAEYAAEFVAALGHVVLNVGDRIGLILYNEDIAKVLPPSSNKTQMGLLMKYLSEPRLYGGGTSLNRAIDLALRITKSDYTIFFLVSDFLSLSTKEQRMLKLLGTKFETVGVMVRDYLDEHLPRPGFQFAFQDPATKKQIVLDPEIAARRYRENALKQKVFTRNLCKSCSIDLLELNTDSDFAIPTAIFLKNRVGRRK